MQRVVLGLYNHTMVFFTMKQ